MNRKDAKYAKEMQSPECEMRISDSPHRPWRPVKTSLFLRFVSFFAFFASLRFTPSAPAESAIAVSFSATA